MLNYIYVQYKRNKNKNLSKTLIKQVAQKFTEELHSLISHTDQSNKYHHQFICTNKVIIVLNTQIYGLIQNSRNYIFIKTTPNFEQKL